MVLLNLSSSTVYFFALIGVYCSQHVTVGLEESIKFKNLFTDPQIDTQDWVLKMINVFPVWEQGIFGKGVRVRVNDYGINTTHPELQNFDLEASCELYEARFNNATDEVDQHGTTVASVIAARGNNSQCGTGIAPEVTLSSCIAAGEYADLTVYNNTWMSYKVDKFDISQNAYGFRHCRRTGKFSSSGEFKDTATCPFKYRPGPINSGGYEFVLTHPCDVCDFPSQNNLTSSCERAIARHCFYHFDGDEEICSDLLSGLTRGGQCSFLGKLDNMDESFEIGAQEGRNGKGVIYLFSAGNDFTHGGDTNYAGRYQSRYVVYAGAVGPNGVKAKYSRAGASVFVTAPAGDIDTNFNYSVALGGGECHRAGSGTTFSSAVVSGVVALILESNPNLTWRDMQGILATSSQRPGPQTESDDETAVINGGGFFHSNYYGFGIVDAFAAVTAAQNWVALGPELKLTSIFPALDLTIGDDPNIPIVSELEVQSDENTTMIVENVIVSVWLRHMSRGHLKITLTSPDGTESILTPGSRPENGQGTEDEPWVLRTVRSWGENAEGNWTLSVVDVVPGDVNPCVDYGNFTIDGSGLTFDCAYLEYFPGFYDEELQQFLVDFFDNGGADACCACGGGVATNGTCVDEIGFDALCNTTVETELCIDGVMDEDLAFFDRKGSNGLTARESCCLFGGGIVYNDTSLFSDELIGWKIDIYGREDVDPTPSPTLMDSQAPTPSPTLIDSQGPTDVPTSAPVGTTQAPTSKPTGGDTPATVASDTSSASQLLISRFFIIQGVTFAIVFAYSS